MYEREALWWEKAVYWCGESLWDERWWGVGGRREVEWRWSEGET